MPLTKRQTANLQGIRNGLKEGIAYLLRQDHAFCVKGGQATTTLHMTRPLDGVVFYELNRDIGSELCYLYNALEDLERFLQNIHPVDKENK